jgi:hypothetical protein
VLSNPRASHLPSFDRFTPSGLLGLNAIRPITFALDALPKAMETAAIVSNLSVLLSGPGPINFSIGVVARLYDKFFDFRIVRSR